MLPTSWLCRTGNLQFLTSHHLPGEKGYRRLCEQKVMLQLLKASISDIAAENLKMGLNSAVVHETTSTLNPSDLSIGCKKSPGTQASFYFSWFWAPFKEKIAGYPENKKGKKFTSFPVSFFVPLHSTQSPIPDIQWSSWSSNTTKIKTFVIIFEHTKSSWAATHVLHL